MGIEGISVKSSWREKIVEQTDRHFCQCVCRHTYILFYPCLLRGSRNNNIPRAIVQPTILILVSIYNPIRQRALWKKMVDSGEGAGKV